MRLDQALVPITFLVNLRLFSIIIYMNEIQINNVLFTKR